MALENLLISHEGLFHIDGKSLWAQIDAIGGKDNEVEVLCDNLVKLWLKRMSSCLTNENRTIETENFFIFSSRSEEETKLLENFVEPCLKRSLKNLEGVADDSGNGKHVVLAFGDADEYYRYLSYYYPEDSGHSAGSSGVLLNSGYQHLALAPGDYNDCEATLAHELSHALVSYLPMPLWLNEAIAVSNESSIIGLPSAIYNPDALRIVTTFWNKDNISTFWDGSSFQDVEAAIPSYYLAEMIFAKISHISAKKTKIFINTADHRDGGEIAINSIFNTTMNSFVSSILGPGEWIETNFVSQKPSNRSILGWLFELLKPKSKRE